MYDDICSKPHGHLDMGSSQFSLTAISPKEMVLLQKCSHAKSRCGFQVAKPQKDAFITQYERELRSKCNGRVGKFGSFEPKIMTRHVYVAMVKHKYGKNICMKVEFPFNINQRNFFEYDAFQPQFSNNNVSISNQQKQLFLYQEVDF